VDDDDDAIPPRGTRRVDANANRRGGSSVFHRRRTDERTNGRTDESTNRNLGVGKLTIESRKKDL
jgi:hypothetical protein